MESKKWYESKIVQVMILQVLFSFFMLLQDFLAKNDFSSVAIVGLLGSIIVIVLRIFYSDTKIVH
jgi:hypothetical protein